MSILVFGARGSIGRQVLGQLVAAGEAVRASVRSHASAHDLPAGVVVVEADLTRPETLPAALDGVAKVFLYGPTGGVDVFLDAARGAGLERVVLLSSGSVLLPYAPGNAIAEEHRAVERRLAASGLPWTPIRPLVLANNAMNWASSIREENVVRLVAPEALTAPIHERDVAAVAVAALLGEATEEILTGPELVSQARQVELIAEATGRPIRVAEISADQARERFGDPAVVEAVLQFLAEAAAGRSPVTDTVQRVLGRPGATFAEWARDHAAGFR